MKNLLFGLIATVLFSFTGNAQSDFDSFGLKHNKVLEVILMKCDKNINKTNVFDISKSIVLENFPEYKNTQFIQFDDYSSPEILLSQVSKKGLINPILYNLNTNNQVRAHLYSEKIFDFYLGELRVETKSGWFVEKLESKSALRVAGQFFDAI